MCISHDWDIIFSLVLILWFGFDLMALIYSTTNLMVETLPSDLSCRITSGLHNFRVFSSLLVDNGNFLEK
jgi:hypothetical protein